MKLIFDVQCLKIKPFNTETVYLFIALRVQWIPHVPRQTVTYITSVFPDWDRIIKHINTIIFFTMILVLRFFIINKEKPWKPLYSESRGLNVKLIPADKRTSSPELREIGEKILKNNVK